MFQGCGRCSTGRSSPAASSTRSALTDPGGVSSPLTGWDAVEALQVALQVGDDAGVSGGFGRPAAVLGVGVQCLDIGELVLQGGCELWSEQ